MEMVVKLGDICSFQSGGTPSRRNPEYFSGNIPWITTTALNGKKIGRNDAVALITEQAVAESAAKIVPAGSIMVGTRVGVGKVAINTEVMSTSQDIISLLNIDENVWDKEFLCKFLQSKSSFLNSQARGATIKGIKIDVLSELDLPVMSKEEQTHISEIVDNVKKLISIRQQQLEKLDELVKARFVEMFGDRYVNDKNWNTTKLGNSISFNNGKAHEQIVDENGEYILVTSRAIASNFKDVRRTNELLSPLHKDDIVMVMSDVPNGRALAKCQLIKDNNKYTLNQRICSFDNYNYNPVFLLFLLSRHPYFLSFNDGNGQTNLRKNDILDCKLIDPPIELQEQFADFVSQVDKSKAAIQRSFDEAQLLFDILMRQYFE